MKLSDIADNAGSRKKRMRVGPWHRFGQGQDLRPGGKGQTARSGVRIKGFEGGQLRCIAACPAAFQQHLPARLRRGQSRPHSAGDRCKSLRCRRHHRRRGAGEVARLRRAKDGVRLLGAARSGKVNIEVHGASKSAIAAVERPRHR